MKDYSFKINGNQYSVGVEIKDDTQAEVIVNGTRYNVEMENTTVKKAIVRPQVAAAPASHPVQTSAAPARKAAQAAAGETPVLSPLPGVVLDIKVSVGDSVSEGQLLLVLEAMKMENDVSASCSGVVKSIAVRPSDSVLEGDLLITIG